jgi:Holliday junction resolvasome RuvABC DNA-binding subunit
MSPEAVEGFNKFEGQQNFQNEKYLDIERGDIDPMQLQQNQAQNQLTQQQQSQQQFDPVVFVKNMISLGFTPSQAQIAGASANLSGPSDSTNTWFAIFLQKLMRQARAKRGKS